IQTDTTQKVSVVIPVFNAASYLLETLASVQAQTYPAIEVIAVDDGSVDESLDMLESFPGSIKIIRQQNSGPAAARNRGAQEASGRWIAFLDADDVWESDKIERQLAACSRFIWSYTDLVFVGGGNDGRRDSEFTQKHSGMILEHLVRSNFIGTSS